MEKRKRWGRASGPYLEIDNIIKVEIRDFVRECDL